MATEKLGPKDIGQEVDLVLDAVRFGTSFLTTSLTSLTSRLREADIEELRDSVLRDGDETRFNFPDLNYDLISGGSFNGSKVAFSIRLTDITKDPGTQPYISFHMFPEGHIRLAVGPDTTSDEEIDSRVADSRAMFRQRLCGENIMRTFRHFGLNTDILNPPQTLPE